MTISAPEARERLLHLLQRAEAAGADDQPRGPLAAAQLPGRLGRRPGSPPAPRPCWPSRARSRPTRRAARPRRRRDGDAAPLAARRPASRTASASVAPSGSSQRLAVQLDPHAATPSQRPRRRGRPRPAAPAGCRCGSGRWRGAGRRARPGPISGRLSGRAGAQAGGRLDQLQLGDLGEQPVGLAQQLVDAAGGDRGVEAPLLDRGADDQPPVGARHEVDALGGDDPLDTARLAPPGERRSRIWPLTGRTGGRASSGSHAACARPGAGGEDDRGGAQLLAGRGAHAGEPLALDQRRARPRPRSAPRPPRARAPPAARRSAPAGRPSASPGAMHAAAAATGVRPGSSSRQRARRQPLGLEAELRCRSWRRRSSSASSRSSATCSAPRTA